MSRWQKKLSREPNDERRYSSAPIAQMRMLPVVAFCQLDVSTIDLLNKSCQYFFVVMPTYCLPETIK